MDTNELFALKSILSLSHVELDVRTPEVVEQHLGAAREIVQKIAEVVGANTHGQYFQVSVKRYEHYLAAAMNLERGAKILDVGNAPGHVGIGLHLLGFEVTGINLNREWRATYPSPEWLHKLNVRECDIENEQLPFADDSFDAVYFTEVLEHIAITDPAKVCAELRRVLKTDGLLLLSTPNVCNISNVHALLNGKNIFWDPEIFYGSTDRHNREYTPAETERVLETAGFERIRMYGMNCDSNWRSSSAVFTYDLLSKIGDEHPMLRNTTMVLASK
jgi:2-polyprenyl-3-methyl-5-hydroxy-6-metoxy-1,4-benzoquinol methylase